MNSRRFTFIGIWMLVLTAVLGSCGMMDDEGPDCTTHRRIRFTYDWNMLFADAFPHEVKTLTLYAFTTDGRLAYSQTVNADSVIAQGYMNADGMLAGRYRFLVWAQGEQRHADTYSFGTAAIGDTNDVLTVRLNRAATADVDHDITPLYYGTLDNVDFTDLPRGGIREATVNLMKDTELFRIVLQNQSGQTLDPGEFCFTITDNNGFLAADNSLLADDTLTYHAWSVTNGTAGISDTTATGTVTAASAVVAEITTNRLVAGRNMRLHVTRRSDGHRIIDLPLIDLGLLVKGNYHRAMSDQEYLDRQDTWNYIFFLDNDRNWLAASIYVQQWRIVLQDADL